MAHEYTSRLRVAVSAIVIEDGSVPLLGSSRNKSEIERESNANLH